MANGIRVIPDILRLLAFGGVGAAFLPVGAVYTNPIRILSIKNATNSDMEFSYDGVNAHEYLPASSGIVLDFTANSSPERFPFIASGTTIYVRYASIAPTSGNIAISAYYCAGD